MRPKTAGNWLLTALLIFAAFGASLIFADIGGYIDEADNVAVAQLILLDGSVLYRDLFSHHFPFAYYWTALFFKLFGISIFSARLAVIMLAGLAFITVGLIWRNVRVGALAWLIWACVSPFFLGHLMLYQGLAAVSLAPVLAGGLAYVGRRPLPNLWVISLIGVFAACAILANPLTIFAVGLTLASMAWPFVLGRQRRYESALCSAFVCAPLIGVLLGAGLFLWMNDGLAAFYRDVIVFNRDIYARYSDTVRAGLTANLGKIALNALSALTLLDPSQRMYPIESLADYSLLANWLISDLTFKLIILAYCVWLALRRRFASALYIYAFAACALMRGRTNFDQLPLLMCAVMVMAIWCVGEVSKYQGVNGSGDAHTHSSPFGLHRLILLPFMTLLVIIGVDFGLNQRNSPAAAQVLEKDATTALTLKQWTCGQSDVKLGYYPANPYVHFYSQLRPVSRYLFVWPWVAEVGADDIAVALKTQPHSIVNIVARGDIWGVPNAVSLAPIVETLQQHGFVKLDDPPASPDDATGRYLSRPLYDACVQKLKNEKFQMKN
ncbi:MAG: hypothetical protein KIH69_014090 [Anaerolineae bacterium]|nr:hypothetical protein [Anaerolineae bacterium]